MVKIYLGKKLQEKSIKTVKNKKSRRENKKLWRYLKKVVKVMLE
jgi:hypothetical protein